MGFLNKNAFIQVALLSTYFCTAARDAFFLMLRNAVRFSVTAMLGSIIHLLGKVFVMVVTGLCGFFTLQAMHPEIDFPVVLVILYVLIGYLIGSLFMNVFGLAVDTTLQCFIATEEMGIDKSFVPSALTACLDEVASEAKGQ